MTDALKKLISDLREHLKDDNSDPSTGICEYCGYRVINPCKTAIHRSQCELS